MQKSESLSERLLVWGANFCLIATFSLCVYLFWQNGLFATWLGSLGYLALALLIAAVVNGLFVMLFLAANTCGNAVGRIADVVIPTNDKAAK